MIWLMVLALFILALAVALKYKPRAQPHEYPYIKAESLFTPAERSFFGVLEQAVGSDFRIFGKIRVADVVNVRSMPNRSLWQRAFNRINAKHFDFILCSKDDLAVQCAIELNDRSHESTRARSRDSFLEGVCKSISFPLVQIEARHAYSISKVREKILGTIRLKLDPAPSPVSTEERENVHTSTENLEAAHAPVCPRCRSVMVRRRAKSGTRLGEEFWGCSSFPKCRSVLPITDNAESIHS